MNLLLHFLKAADRAHERVMNTKIFLGIPFHIHGQPSSPTNPTRIPAITSIKHKLLDSPAELRITLTDITKLKKA